MHTFSETVTVYIKFCQGVCIPSKSVTETAMYGVTRQSKLITAFQMKSRTFHQAKGNLRKANKDARKALKDRLEKKFASNNSRDIWSSIDSIMEFKGPKTTVSTDDTLSLNPFLFVQKW